MMSSMSTPLGLQSLVGLGLLALITCGCSPEPSGSDEADSSSDTGGEDSTDGDTGTSTATDTGTEDGSTCDEEALNACIESATENPCSLGCPEAVLSCTDADCQASCELAQHSAVAECHATHCPGEPDDVEVCEQGCWQELSTCIAEADCDLHQCQWDAGFCLPDCAGCTADVVLDYVYADSCELPLPELVHPVLHPYFSIEVGGQSYGVADEGTACDVELGATIEHPLQGDVLLLCPDVCDAFTDAGSLRVLVKGPC
jgi:hypothetical protein